MTRPPERGAPPTAAPSLPRADVPADEPAAGVLPPDPEVEDGGILGSDAELEARGAAFFSDRRRIATLVAALGLGIVAIYVLLPKVVGLGDTLHRVSEAKWYWVVVAIGFELLAFAAYTALFRGVLGGREGGAVRRRLGVRASYEIALSGLAATLLFSAAGAGGIALTYWALRKAGMPRRLAACRMVAFLVLLYTIYLSGVLIFGILLRTGVLHGPAPVAATIVPAAIAGGALAVLILVARIPGDVERRLAELGTARRGGLARRLVTVPATLALGVRTALAYLRHPRSGGLALLGAVGYWAANIGNMWASFAAFGIKLPLAVLALGYFLGMAANLLPSPTGGVGPVDAGLIGAFLLFGLHTETVFAGILTYRVIAFWLPIPPGVVAYFRLRRTVALWEREDAGYTSESKVTAASAT